MFDTNYNDILRKLAQDIGGNDPGDFERLAVKQFIFHRFIHEYGNDYMYAALRNSIEKLLDMTKRRIVLSTTGIYISPITIHTRILFDLQDSIEIVADLKTKEVQYEERPIVYVPVEYYQMPPDVFECQFCGGFTKNDSRGNCAACGAPRKDNKTWHPKPYRKE